MNWPVPRNLRGYAKEAVRRYARSQHRPQPHLDPAYWNLSYVEGSGLVVEGLPLRDLAQEYGTPLHVFSPRRLQATAEKYRAVPPGAARAHGVFFSYKTGPIPELLREVHAAGLGAEVISEQELDLALRLGVPGSQIIYNGPAKSDASLQRAIDAGAALINVNHREEIRRVAAAAATVGRDATVGLRINVGIGWGDQFGETVGPAALAACREIVATSHLHLVGLHVHVGYLQAAAQLARVVDTSADFAAQVRRELGVTIEALDIGGGLWSPSVRQLSREELRRNALLEMDLSRPDLADRYGVEAYVVDAHRLVNDAFTSRHMPVPQILLEPGRGLCGDAQFLLAQVVETRQKDGRNYLILDAGINIADALQGEFHEIFAVAQPPTRRDKKYRLVGPICVPSDCLRHTWYGPAIARGDFLAIMDTGAYFVPWSNSFSFPRPGIVSVRDGHARVTRQQETLDYLTALDVPKVDAGVRPAESL